MITYLLFFLIFLSASNFIILLSLCNFIVKLTDSISFKKEIVVDQKNNEDSGLVDL